MRIRSSLCNSALPKNPKKRKIVRARNNDRMDLKWLIERVLVPIFAAVLAVVFGSFIVIIGISIAFDIDINDIRDKLNDLGDTDPPVINEDPPPIGRLTTPSASPSPAPTTPISPTPTYTATSPNNQLSTTTLVVPGNSERGIQFRVSQSGTCSFRYISGAYCTYPLSQLHSEGDCLTSVIIFREGIRHFEDDEYSVNQFAPGVRRLAITYGGPRTGYWLTLEAAERAAMEQATETTLSVTGNEILTLLAVDGLDYYFDNPGSVTVEVLCRSGVG